MPALDPGPNNNDLTFEEYCAYNDALKPVLGLA